MSTRRKKKQAQHLVIDSYVMTKALTPEQGLQFKAMYSRARSLLETEQVTRVLHDVLDGWKSGTDLFSRLMQEGNDLNEQDDEDSPALRLALEQSRVCLSRR